MMDQYHPSGSAKRKLKGQREVGHGGSSAEGKITLHHLFFLIFFILKLLQQTLLPVMSLLLVACQQANTRHNGTACLGVL